MAEPNTILRCIIGSTVHGLGVKDQDDRDEMGICIEPWHHFFGLRPKFEQWTWRTKPEGARSGPGDLDLVIYSLAKWARLAIGGNPSILTLLFVPEKQVLINSFEGQRLRSMAPMFIGNNIFGPYLGYMQQQRHRLTNKVKIPNRPELIEAYGFDTKYAGHLVRLGYQGLELAKTGRMTLPMAEPMRSHIVDIRTGKVSEKDVLKEAQEMEDELLSLQKESKLGMPHIPEIEAFVIDCYMNRHRPSLL